MKKDTIVTKSDLKPIKACLIIVVVLSMFMSLGSAAAVYFILGQEIAILGEKNIVLEETLNEYDNIEIECNLEDTTTSLNVTYVEGYTGSFRVYISTKVEMLLITIYVDGERVASRYVDVINEREMVEYYYRPDMQIKVVIG